jgi:exodeoxyribonuclease-3
MKRLPAWIRALIWISGRKLQRHAIQLMLDANYADGFRSLHTDDRGYTFPTWDPHVRLDYAFVPKRFLNRLISCEVIRDPAEAVKEASDHCPLLATLEI